MGFNTILQQKAFGFHVGPEVIEDWRNTLPLRSTDELQHIFPLEEEFIDHSGHSRLFRISFQKLIAEDFNLTATDLSQSEGYRFKVYSSVSSDPAVGAALGKLRQKIRRGLSTRYLHVDTEEKKHLTHDQMRGRISYNGIVVDGALLSFRELEEILTTHEGFEISIKIGEST